MSENSVMTFQIIKKRINTELVFDGQQRLYIQKERIEKLSDLLEEGKLKLAKLGTENN